MLSNLPPKILDWICGYLHKEHILNLCLVCCRFNPIPTDALFRCLMCDEVPPLFRAMTVDIAALLVEKYHVDLDCLYAGKNALLHAIDLRYPQAVDLILQYRPNVRYCCDFGGRGPLSLAVIGGNAASVERILQSQEIDVNDRCSDGLSALVYALKHREYYVLQLLLADSRVNVNIADSLGWTPLQTAILEGNHIAAQMLVRHAGIDINRHSSHNDAPLLLAVKSLNRQQSIPTVESLLLNPDLDVNISDSNGRTALWHAVNQCHYDLVKLFLRQSHLRLNNPDRYGMTPLARAAEKPVLQVLELSLKQPQIRVKSWSREVVPPLWFAWKALLTKHRNIEVRSGVEVDGVSVGALMNRLLMVKLLTLI
ncbi:hypothetical protein N7451_012877 [Penicillium sp. IBT 35674x]|nr:hypothetical protein N7451_012877 [Penicillium sp. IBT 35674x]